MTKEDIFKIALRQSAIDMNCRPGDFLGDEPVFTEAKIADGARAYYREPIAGHFVTYGKNVVASWKPVWMNIAQEYMKIDDGYGGFETPAINWLQNKLEPIGLEIKYQAEYFLPDPDRVPSLSCPFPMKILTHEDFRDLYLPEWSNALCRDRSHLDILGVAAFDGDRIVGLAACSADCETMWQIGVDVLPAYRRMGVASALTARLTREILMRGKVPFYCAAWSNIASVKNAIRSGFAPAWVEMTVKPKK